MKEQIVEMSGLSPRVIRVWFQNKRCKDKKNQLKQEMQREKVLTIKILYLKKTLFEKLFSFYFFRIKRNMTQCVEPI